MGTKEEQQAARAAAVAKVTELLQSGPKTAAEMYPVVVCLLPTCLRPTFSNYLNHMHKTMRLIHMTGTYRNRGELWALGADITLPSPDDEIDHVFAVKRGIAPARQIGMPRDVLVAALFGPPRGESA